MPSLLSKNAHMCGWGGIKGVFGVGQGLSGAIDSWHGPALGEVCILPQRATCSRHGFLHQRMNANGSDTK
jgi:hypothetical protein